MGIGDLAEGLTRGAERFGDGVSQALEPVVRLGVTGLSRAGKTVFITSLVANLLDRGRMPQFMPAANGAIIAAYLQPQPDDTVPRFDYESHLAALTGENPHWPESTRAVSELRLSLLVRPTGILKSLVRPRRLHLDIVDYPGEWLLDLALLHKTYAQWSADMLERIRNRALAQPFLAQAAKLQSVARFEESQAQDLARRYTGYLRDARDAGLSDCTPGRFLLPGELRGAPVLTFAPLNRPERPARASLWREMERRYDAYRKQVVKPFFRNHFARIDRQVVLVDALGAIHDGPEAVADMNRAMADILAAFRPGHNGRLSRLLRGRRVEKILFAATKADHLHHHQHPRLTAIMQAMLRQSRDRVEFSGATTDAMSIASLRTTVEEVRNHNGNRLNCVRGILLDGAREAAFYPGELPDDPAVLLDPARSGATRWLDADYQVMSFAPARLTLRPGDGPPHIRLDKALQFLIGDKL